MLTPDESAETAARAADLRSRMTNDMVKRFDTLELDLHQVVRISDSDQLTIIKAMADEAMFYVEHLLLEIEGK